ncbi:unnamed protein product [Durusdinium trenchii]|uniref:Tyrosine-protein kinase ephrin type A/B receptor-like domain-containing protein n=1 Tax=Durusdinium trenchii TaxID=1381693 RepID=A0ABP0J8E4_9DINO
MHGRVPTWLHVFLVLADIFTAAKPLCRDSGQSGQWQDCRIQIGGLAIQGAEAFHRSLGPTFQDYLTQVYNGSNGLEFEALPLNFDENFALVGAGNVDFIYSNPAAYMCMAVEFEVQTVASLVNFRKGYALSKFAGVIFARANSTFQTVEDLRRARVEAVSISGLGAMQLQQAELLAQGLDIMTDVPRLTFAFNQNKIVQDVQSGVADVGFVRTDLIDRLVERNQTSWAHFRVIGEIPNADTFPFSRSTAFTPEWPIGALSHVPDAIREMVGSALMSLDRASADPLLSEPAIQGNFASWTTPSNYLGLLDVLQKVRYFDPVQRRCLRSSDEYDAIFCPEGYVKRSAEQVFCSDCPDTYSCLCSPCAKLRDPEFVLKVELLSTSWKGNVDLEQVANSTVLANSCERMTVCGHVFSGQKLRWVLLDQIGATQRRAINAPLLDSVNFRMTIDGPTRNTTVQNVTVSDLDTQMFYLDFEAQDNGAQVIQVDINGLPAIMSPVVLKVEPAPLRDLLCPPGYAANEEGLCMICPAGTASLGGLAPCRPCDPGTKQPLEGQANCESCPVGEYQAESAAAACIPCEPGSSSRGKTGSRACSPCEPGQEAPESGMERCTACRRGYYSEQEGAAHCLQCQGGKGTSEQGTTDPSLCICLEGERLLRDSNMSEHCVSCGIGLSCTAGNGDPEQLAGFWVDVVDAERKVLSVFRCRNVLECPAGPLGGCASGREGRACNNCESWYQPSNDGTCDPCEGVDALPVLWVILGVLLLSFLTWAFAQTSLARQRLGQVTVFLTAGQVIVLMQLMAALKSLEFQWAGPAVPVLQALSLLAFDLDFMNLGCVVANDGPTLSFFSQLMAYPVFSVCMLLVWWCMTKCQRGIFKGSELLNINGLVLMTLYVTLTIVSLLPWQCVRNPNGTLTMQTQPGVVCFDSDEHTGLLALSALGMIMYPIPMLAVSIQATVMYPSYVASGQGLVVVNRYRFIFERFRASRYFFGVLYLVRNTLLSLIPVVLANFPSVQVAMLACVMLMGVIIQMRAWPWRTQVANLTDMVFSSGVVLFLVIAGPILDFETEADEKSYAMFLSWSFCLLLLTFCLAFFIVAVIYLQRRFNPVKPYKVFLTHQKGAAGSLARFIKSILNKHSSDGVFLDSDELQDLDSLFECVRSQVGYLVPLVTPAMMTRPWCVGELATAFLNNVPILPISCSGASPISPGRVPAILNSWSTDEFQPLLAAGIDERGIEATFEHLATLKAIPYDRSSELEHQESSILRIISHCEMKRRPFVDYSSKSTRARVLILSHTEHEAISTSMILQMQLQQQLQENVLVPRSTGQMHQALNKAETLIILLHTGILYDPTFAGMVLAAYAQETEDHSDLATSSTGLAMVKSLSNASDSYAWQKMVIVSADPNFTFPSSEFYTSLAAQGLSTDDMGPECGPKLCEAYRSIFKKISLPFSPCASESLISHQVKEIGKRLSSLLEGNVTRTNTVNGRRISTHSNELQAMKLAFRSPESSMPASPRQQDEETGYIDHD